MSDDASKALDNLRLAIHGVMAPFSCAGTFTPEKPVTLLFKDETRFEVVRAKSSFDQRHVTLQPLLDRCKPARFGAGKQTRYDRHVRDAFQLDAQKGGLTVENFDPESAGILQQIQQTLVPQATNPISAELYALNVYVDGGHFEPHKDTPRGSDMMGTLVVCLPSQFSKGQLVLRHRGIVQKFDWGNAIRSQENPNQLHWAAFFGDVDHQIETVWSGARVTLTYLLRRGPDAEPLARAATKDFEPHLQEAWRALLADPKFLRKGGTLAYPCCHLYHHDARFQRKQRPITKASAAALKGRDHLVAATALELGLEVIFTPYMFENCADESWQLERFPTRSEEHRLGQRMDPDKLARVLPLRASSEDGEGFDVIWIDPPPTCDKTSWQSGEDDDSELPAAARLHSCEFSPTGYFGNEGSDLDFYTYAALHIEIPPFGEGPRAATPSLAPVPRKRKPSPRKPRS
jgi:hypothetical protein